MKYILVVLSMLAFIASPAFAHGNKHKGQRSDGCNGSVSCGGGTPVPVGK